MVYVSPPSLARCFLLSFAAGLWMNLFYLASAFDSWYDVFPAIGIVVFPLGVDVTSNTASRTRVQVSRVLLGFALFYKGFRQLH